MRTPRIGVVVAVAATIALAVSGCSAPSSERPPATAKGDVPSEEHLLAADHFEAFLADIDELMLVMSAEPWSFEEYGNRPVSCGLAGGGGDAGFGLFRHSRSLDEAEEPIATNIEQVRSELQDAGYEVGEITSLTRSESKTFAVSLETGLARVTFHAEPNWWGVSASSTCIDIDDRAVWREANALGYQYIEGYELRPGERLEILPTKE